jgi:threonine dehydrogenase-like Zn-dependent dehydrogenase
MKTKSLDVSVPRIVLTRALARVWRGAYFAPTSCLRLAQFPDPPLPAPAWVRVKNSMCGICSSDLHQLLVDADLDVEPVALPSHQRIYLGHEMIGVITWDGTQISTFEAAMQWLLDGKIKTEKLVTHRFRLDEYRQAFATALDKRNTRSIKVAFEMNHNGTEGTRGNGGCEC